MCKPLDNEPSLHQQVAKTSICKKRVRFGENEEFLVDRDITESNKGDVWYNNDEYRLIKQEIGTLIRYRNLGLDTRGQDEALSCFRGLEFLKHGSGPSRKERRVKFMKDVLFYNNLLKSGSKSTASIQQRQKSLGDFCSKLSQEAQKRAQSMASLDACEARRVYHESHFIYEKNGKDCKMFSHTTDQLALRTCREQEQMEQSSSSSSYYYYESSLLPVAVQDLFSYALNTAAIFLR